MLLQRAWTLHIQTWCAPAAASTRDVQGYRSPLKPCPSLQLCPPGRAIDYSLSLFPLLSFPPLSPSYHLPSSFPPSSLPLDSPPYPSFFLFLFPLSLLIPLSPLPAPPSFLSFFLSPSRSLSFPLPAPPSFHSSFLSPSRSLSFPLPTPPSFPSSPPLLPHLPVEFSLRSDAGDSPTAEHKHTVIHRTLVPRGRWERFGQPLGEAE